MIWDYRELAHISFDHIAAFLDESKIKLLRAVALARMMDNSSIVTIPIPIDVLGYYIEVVMLEKSWRLLRPKEISASHIIVHMKSVINVYSFLGII